MKKFKNFIRDIGYITKRRKYKIKKILTSIGHDK